MRLCGLCGQSLEGYRGNARFCKPCRKEHARNRAKKWYWENKPKKQAYDAEYRERTREERRAASRRWAKNNPNKANHYTQLRRTRMARRTPQWADVEFIRQIYENCPREMQVDHIVPLRGKSVSGLHVPENLQYLTMEENYAKSNRYPWWCSQ